MHLRNSGKLLIQKRIEQGVELQSEAILVEQERLLELCGQLLKLREIELITRASLLIRRRSC